MTTLSRTQLEALGCLAYSYRTVMHYNTRRSLSKLGLLTWGPKQELVLTAAGRRVAHLVTETIEGTAPLGVDAQGDQIRQVELAGHTFTWSV